jgi:cytochrome c-type biogenesis protein CcmH
MKHKTIVVGLILLILLFPNTAAIAQHSKDKALEKTAREIYDLIMCPICAGQTIARSNSETSIQMRDLVLKKLRQGQTKEEVLQYFVSRYGERIMAEPNKKGLNLLLWFLPFVLVAFAAILIYSLIRRWAVKDHAVEDSHLEKAQLFEYQERLEKELKEFDKEF